MSKDTSNRVYIKGYIDFPADAFSSLKDAWETHVALSREEAGNILFDYEYDAEVVGRVHISEIYESKDAFEAHRARALQAGWVELSRDAQRHLDIKDTPFD